MTLAVQIDKMKLRFRPKHVVLVVDWDDAGTLTEEIRSLVAVYSALGYTTGPARCCR
jgi:hypothetical protein